MYLEKKAMKKLLITLSFSMAIISLDAAAQVPTGTRQRSSNDTLLKKSVPAPTKYNPKATKWPKPDSLKAIPVKKDSTKAKPLKKQKPTR